MDGIEGISQKSKIQVTVICTTLTIAKLRVSQHNFSGIVDHHTKYLRK